MLPTDPDVCTAVDWTRRRVDIKDNSLLVYEHKAGRGEVKVGIVCQLDTYIPGVAMRRCHAL